MAIVKPLILEDGETKTAGTGDQVPQTFVEGLSEFVSQTGGNLNTLDEKIDSKVEALETDLNTLDEKIDSKVEDLGTAAYKDNGLGGDLEAGTAGRVTCKSSDGFHDVPAVTRELSYPANSYGWSEDLFHAYNTESPDKDEPYDGFHIGLFGGGNQYYYAHLGFGKNDNAGEAPWDVANAINLYPVGGPDPKVGNNTIVHSGNLRDETGQSVDFPMSQKAVTDELNDVVPQAEAEAGTATTRRAWTAQRVRQAAQGWWDGFGTAFGRDFVSLADAAAGRSKLGLGSAATRNVGTSSGQVMEVGAFGLGRHDIASNYNYTSNPSTNGIIPEGLSARYVTTGVNNPTSRDGALLSYRYQSWGAMLKIGNGNDIRFAAIDPSGSNGLLPWVEVTHSGNLRAATGTSTEYPMTQRATTNAIQGVSDGRDKTNIQPTNIGLELIKKLNPVSYNLNKRDLYRTEEATTIELVGDEGGSKEEVTKVCSETLKKPLTDYDNNDGHLARTDKYTGLIAQDVKAAYESLGLDMCIVKNLSEEYEGGEDRYYIEYNGLIPVLINAVKELSARVEELEGD